MAAMPDTRTISQLEAEGYDAIGCECCRGLTCVPFQMIRAKVPALSPLTLDEVGARMKCESCGKRPARYFPHRQRDARGFAKSY